MFSEKKDFRGDIKKIFNALSNNEKFSFSKYADGEFEILRGNKITNCDNWTFNPEIHKKVQKELLLSYKFDEDGYYVGISCPCCVPIDDVKWMRNNVGVKSNNLTWANIFVNGNYKFFIDNFIPEFKNHQIVLIANKDANLNKLPFNVEEHIKIGNSAFIENFNLIDELPKRSYKNKLFLFCAGPLGNILVYKMWKYNKNNIYIDIGSTLNPYLIGSKNRGYLKGNNSIKKICKW